MDEDIFKLFNTPPDSPAQKKPRTNSKRDSGRFSSTAPYPVSNASMPQGPAPVPPPHGQNQQMDEISQAQNLAGQTLDNTNQYMDPYNVIPEPQKNLGPASQVRRNNTTASKATYTPEDYYPSMLDERVEMRSNSSKKYLAEQFYSQVLTRPLFNTPSFLQEAFGISTNSFNVNTIIHTFEIALSIAVIVLTSSSITNDREISGSVWLFLIAMSSILLAVSLLFVLRVMNFEHNNGIFYALVGSGLSISGMGVCIGIILPEQCGVKSNYCKVRQAETALIIIMAIVWLVNLVQFLTVFYISSLNLIPEIKFVPVPSTANPPPVKTDDYSKRFSEHTLVDKDPPKPYLLKDGTLFEANDTNMAQKCKVELYA